MSRLLEAVSQLEVSLTDPLDVNEFDASNPSGFYENLTGTQDYLTTVLHGRGVCQPGASDLVSVHWYQESAAPDDHNLYQGQGPAVSYLLIRELT
jgi:hypothetical protein